MSIVVGSCAWGMGQGVDMFLMFLSRRRNEGDPWVWVAGFWLLPSVPSWQTSLCLIRRSCCRRKAVTYSLCFKLCRISLSLLSFFTFVSFLMFLSAYVYWSEGAATEDKAPC